MASPNQLIRVSVVEDDEPTREHLRALIRGTPGLVCLSCHASAEAALERLPFRDAEVVLLDLELPDMSGVDFIRAAKARRATFEILALTIHDDPTTVFASLEAGASGYLTKGEPAARILEAIREVHQHLSPMSGPIARLVVETFQRRGRTRQALEDLSRRESEILGLLARGHRYREIAVCLGISERTVNTHLYRIYQKLHVRSAVQATAAYHEGTNAGADGP